MQINHKHTAPLAIQIQKKYKCNANIDAYTNAQTHIVLVYISFFLTFYNGQQRLIEHAVQVQYQQMHHQKYSVTCNIRWTISTIGTQSVLQLGFL